MGCFHSMKCVSYLYWGSGSELRSSGEDTSLNLQILAFIHISGHPICSVIKVYILVFMLDVVVVLLFPANNTAMERYNIIQNNLLEATREAIRLIGLVALIMAYKVNKCMWPTGVRGQGSDRGMHHGAKGTCRFRGVGSVLINIKQVSRDWLGLHDRLLRHSLIFFQVILS